MKMGKKEKTNFYKYLTLIKCQILYRSIFVLNFYGTLGLFKKKKKLKLKDSQKKTKQTNKNIGDPGREESATMAEDETDIL